MTNAERFKTPKERTIAFRKFCTNKICKGCDANCIFSDKIHDSFGFKCEFAWLDLEYKEELKPCPFCGCEKISTLVLHGDERKLRCTKCGAQTSVFIDKKDMIDSWNRRV